MIVAKHHLVFHFNINKKQIQRHPILCLWGRVTNLRFVTKASNLRFDYGAATNKSSICQSSIQRLSLFGCLPKVANKQRFTLYRCKGCQRCDYIQISQFVIK